MLSPRLLNRLRTLRLALLGTAALREGSHRHSSRGHSLEFAEHREYVAGDDVRHLDWNVYARSDRFVVKVFQSEREQPLYVLFDASASMAWEKLAIAAGLAGALAFVGLVAGDKVGLAALGGGCRPLQEVRGLSNWHRLVTYLGAHQEARGQARLSASLRAFGQHHSRPGQIIVISDFLEEDGGLEGLAFLLYQKHRLTLIQLRATQEIEPHLRGDLRLKDMEAPQFRDLTVDSRILTHYRRCLQEHQKMLHDWSRRHSCHYLPIQLPQFPFDDRSLILENLIALDLCKAGLLR